MVQGGKYVCGSLVGNNSNRLELVSTELELVQHMLKLCVTVQRSVLLTILPAHLSTVSSIVICREREIVLTGVYVHVQKLSYKQL